MGDSTSLVNYLIEGLVIILLLVSIGYCYYIDRKISNFKKTQMEFSPVIEHLNQVTDNTEKIVGVLKDTATSSNNELKKSISEAKIIADDLSFLVEVSNKISHTLNLQMHQFEVNKNYQQTAYNNLNNFDQGSFNQTDDMNNNKLSEFSSASSDRNYMQSRSYSKQNNNIDQSTPQGDNNYQHQTVQYDQPERIGKKSKAMDYLFENINKSEGMKISKDGEGSSNKLLSNKFFQNGKKALKNNKENLIEMLKKAR